MISFVIPAWNEEYIIGQCIRSIQNEADNSGLPYEVIVIDNNSTDYTGCVAQLHGAKVIVEKAKGVTRARQKGFEEAQYELVAFIDADNMLPEGWLKHAMKAMEKHNVVAASGPVVYHELPVHKRLFTWAFYTVAKPLTYFMPMMQGGNFIVRKRQLQLVEGFPTHTDFYGEDTETAIRLSKVGKILFDFDMFCYSSARRMQAEGLLTIGTRYMMNFFWMHLYGEPYTKEYQDHRPQ